MTAKKINSPAELREAIKQGEHEYFISLGFARSSKNIYMTKADKFEIFHEVDDHFTTESDKQLLESNIGLAMLNGAFYQYQF